jgi:hypothetical protein
MKLEGEQSALAKNWMDSKRKIVSGGRKATTSFYGVTTPESITSIKMKTIGPHGSLKFHPNR